MNQSVLNIFSFKKLFAFVIVSMLSLSSFAQTVTIVPTGTPTKPNLIPVNNTVTFSINPIVFGTCIYNLSYSWTVLNSKLDTVLKSTEESPKYTFTKEDVYTATLTVKTLPGGYCAANITKTTTSTLKVAKLGGATGAPAPNTFSANALGTLVSAYAMDNNGQIISGPYDHFDPFPADNAMTAALAMDDKGTFFYLPTFMNGSTAVNQGGMIEVWAVDKNGNNPPVVIARFDLNGASTAELGLFRMGLDQKGNAWILAGDGANMYAATFKTNGTKVVNVTDVAVYPVPFETGSAADFQSGDLAFDNKGNMYVLAGSSTGTNIYTMSTSTADAKLSKKWKVTDAAGRNFGLAVTGTVFDAKGNMYFSALDGIYFIDYAAVNAVTATAVVKKVSENFGLMDLATSQFPAAWVAPFPGVTLPVELKQFSGTAGADKVYLNWIVSSNETGNLFELEKSTDGAGFKTQALILTTNKQGEEVYSFTDAKSTSDRIYYRLKMVSQDGVISYSNTLLFESKAKESSAITLFQNPVYNVLRFQYIAAKNGAAEISIFTSAGVKMVTQKQNLQKGINSVTIPANNGLAKGVYFLEVKEASTRQVVSFIKQ
ncbi:MAG: T9SS type A sorting domain-containing protein [Chitinophagaceae bacterium]|nr:MAG: T9SS type A sorting domain-containing protein [Chitinophagaceae bacterium]